MDNYKYITVPKQITLSEYKQNGYCLAPSKYSRFLPCEKVNYISLDKLCTESKNKISFNKKNEYYYSEISDIDVTNGSVNQSRYYGINIPSENAKVLKQGDIVVSTVRTYRGGVGFIYDDVKNHCCSPAILIIRNVGQLLTKEYLFSVLRTNLFIEQILGFLNRGMYPRLDKEAMKHILIPIPKSNDILRYITILTKAYLNKISIIKERHKNILNFIEQELLGNQKPNKFKFELPTIKEIEQVGRLDTGVYTKQFKKIKFLIENYKKGFSNIYDLGFTLNRGQNLQESNIGKSVYSEKYFSNFYNLALPTHFSDYGTINKVIYLGNPNKLKTLKQGEIIFGAEGTFRSIVICSVRDKYITNIHGITLYNKDLTLSIFVKCYMDYLTHKGVIDCVKVGGHGGSFAQKYWEIIPFPKFDKSKQKEIALLYHNPESIYPIDTFTLNNFLEQDNDFNKTAGIYELDKTAKQLKAILNKAIDDIANDREVSITFKTD